MTTTSSVTFGVVHKSSTRFWSSVDLTGNQTSKYIKKYPSAQTIPFIEAIAKDMHLVERCKKLAEVEE